MSPEPERPTYTEQLIAIAMTNIINFLNNKYGDQGIYIRSKKRGFSVSVETTPIRMGAVIKDIKKRLEDHPELEISVIGLSEEDKEIVFTRKEM